MQTLTTIHNKADVLAIYKNALLDKELAGQLKFLRQVPAGHGAYNIADLACRWALAALTEAKASGMLEAFAAPDVLTVASFALASTIVEG